MLLLDTTKKIQSDFAAYCRSTEQQIIFGSHTERFEQYRSLVYNVIDDTLQSAFPLTHELLSEEEWQKAVHIFFEEHNAQTPVLWQLPGEFVQFANHPEFGLSEKYPFISELLLFEWLEVKLFMMEDISVRYLRDGNLQTDNIVLNPESHFQHFIYPVYLKKANEITYADKGNYFMVMHREPEEGKVLITDLSPFLLATLEILAEGPQSINQLLIQASEEFSILIDEPLKNGTYLFYKNILETKLILGFKN